MQLVLTDYILILGWIFALVISVSVAMSIFIWILNKLTGDISLLREIKKKNLAAGILIGAAVLGVALIISAVV